jgi:hypothetical protein
MGNKGVADDEIRKAALPPLLLLLFEQLLH